MKGQKFDQDKPRWDLLPWNELESVVKVLTNGSKKYADNNWKIVPESRRRYFAAMHRHLIEWERGNLIDLVSEGGDGQFHLAHLVCDALFLMWFDNNERSKNVSRPKKNRKRPSPALLRDNSKTKKLNNYSRFRSK
jgi:hypothetical protein